MHSTSQNPLVLSSSMNSVSASLLFFLPFICLYCRQPALTYLNKPFCVSSLLLSFPRLPFNLSARLDSPPSREWRPAAGSAYISSFSVISPGAKFRNKSSSLLVFPAISARVLTSLSVSRSWISVSCPFVAV